MDYNLDCADRFYDDQSSDMQCRDKALFMKEQTAQDARNQLACYMPREEIDDFLERYADGEPESKHIFREAELEECHFMALRLDDDEYIDYISKL